MSTSTMLALPAVIEKKVQPRPTKTEMIEALAHRKLEQLREEQRVVRAKAEKIGKEFDVLLKEYAIKNQFDLMERHLHINRGSIFNDTIRDVNVVLDITLPAELAKKRRELAAAQTASYYRLPEFNDVKRQVREALSGRAASPDGTSRVSAMLKDPQMAAALDKLLKELDGTAAKAVKV